MIKKNKNLNFHELKAKQIRVYITLDITLEGVGCKTPPNVFNYYQCFENKLHSIITQINLSSRLKIQRCCHKKDNVAFLKLIRYEQLLGTLIKRFKKLETCIEIIWAV